MDCNVALPVEYDGVNIDIGYRIDLIVEREVIVELKSVQRIHPIHQAQLVSYLKLRHCRVGLLINFNVLHLKDGITRMVFGLEDWPARTDNPPQRTQRSAELATDEPTNAC